MFLGSRDLAEIGSRTRQAPIFRGLENWQRDETTEVYVLSLVDDAHPATTQFLDDAVMRDGLAHHEWAQEMLWRAVRYVNPRASLQLRVLGLGLLEDRDVGVGVFPQSEKILVGGLCFRVVS